MRGPPTSWAGPQGGASGTATARPLPGGLAAIEQLLPGFEAELVAGGAVRCNSMQEIRFVASGHEVTRRAASATYVLASRPYIEGHIRRRVFGLPNVTLVDDTSAHGLVPGHNGVRVAGARLPDGLISCDLVVVATGRAGQLPAWLEALGFPAPAEETLTVDIRYASRHFHIPDGYLGRDKLILITAEPASMTWRLTLSRRAVGVDTSDFRASARSARDRGCDQ